MKGCGTSAFLGIAACVLTLACGGVTEADGSGGGANSGGSESTGGGGGSGGANSGGAESGGSSSGGAESGGSVGTGGDASGGAQGTEDCPPAPIQRLFPVIGPFWFGPDPGPCSSSPEDSTYSYSADLLQSSTASGGETYLRDDENRLVAVVSGVDPATYSYSEGQAVESRETHEVVYTLSSTGYPLTAAVTMSDGGPPVIYSYTYADCRLARREGPSDRTYEYDDVGHVVAIVDGGSTTAFDYGCW